LDRKTRIRLEGVKQIGTTAARQISPVDKLYDAKDVYEGVYKIATATKPRSFKEGLRDLPRGIRAAERGK